MSLINKTDQSFSFKSSNSDSNSDGAIPVGDIAFYDNVLPPLIDGMYKITVTQKATDPKTGKSLSDQPYTQQQYFQVQGPRFILDPTLIYSVFPPANALADYRGVMPHIVLTSRTLSWERTLDGEQPTPAGSTPNQPWLALLLLDEDEIIYNGDPLTANPTKVQTLPISQLINLPTTGTILGPQNITLDSITPTTTTCLAIDLAPSTFLAIAPQLRELPFLSHCREVNTSDKEILGITGNGWFSVVSSNRRANAPVDSTVSGVRNIAHLVSLEGLQNYLPAANGSNPIPSNIQKVRLVSLASWTFVCSSNGLNFRELMQNLDIDTLRMPDQTPSSISNSNQTGMPNAATQVTNAMELGYVPLDYTTYQGEHTVAWCRAPFTPVPVQQVERPVFGSADEAKVYDRGTGMFDVSYATAWEIGRLLALADSEFSISLLNWQREINYLINLLLQQQKQLTKFSGLNLRRAALTEGNQDSLVDKRLMFKSVASYLLNSFIPRVSGATQNAAPFFGDLRDPTGIEQVRDELPGLLTVAEINELLDAGKDPARALRRVIANRQQSQSDE